MMKTSDRIFACMFAGLGITAFIGVVFAGAWWHMFTVAVCTTLAAAFLADAREEERKEDHDPLSGRVNAFSHNDFR